MSGSTPLGGADAALTSVVERLIEKELASLAADGKNLRELVTPGEVLVATVRPSNGLTDILEILGNRVAAALPPELVPGDTIAVRVTGFDGERIVLQNLGPVVEEPPGSPAAPPPPAPPQLGAVSYVSDAAAAPESFGPDVPAAPPPATPPPTLPPSVLPIFAARAPSAAPEAPTDLAGSNIVPLPRDRSGGGGGSGSGGGSQRQRGEPGTPPENAAPQPTQEELAARFTVDVRLSRIIIGSRGTALRPIAPVPPPAEPAPDKIAFLSAEFSDLPDRTPRPDDGLPRVPVNPILFAKLPPTLPPGAELVEAEQQELFADIALPSDLLAPEAPGEELRASPLPPPVRGDVTVPRPLSGDGIPIPATPDRDGLAAPPSVPRSFVPAAPGRVAPQAPSAIPAYVESRTPVPRTPSPDAKLVPAPPVIEPPDAIEARIAAARTAPAVPAPTPVEEAQTSPHAALPGPVADHAPDSAVPLADASARASEALRAAGLRKPVAGGDTEAGLPVRRPFVPPLVFRPAAPVRDTGVPAPPLPGARLPAAPPVIPLRAMTPAPAAPAPAAAPAAGEHAPLAVPREAAALLRALNIPNSAGAAAAAKLALDRPQAVPAALEALERALPAGDPRTATLRTIAAFVARLDPAAPTFPTQLAAYVDHVIGGPEPVLRDLAAAEAIATRLGAGDAGAAPADAAATPPALLETLALARIAERAGAADAGLKTQIAQILALARLDPALEAATPQLHAALAALTAQQAGGSPPGTQAGTNVVEFAIPLPLTGEGNVARIRIERDASGARAKLDGDDFRIAFVLDTKHLGTVAIDLATVGRSVDIGVKTEAQRSAEVFKGALASLRQRLEQLRYRVASAHAGVARPGAVPERAWPPPAPTTPHDPRALVDRDA
jgi:hypothetical protein